MDTTRTFCTAPSADCRIPGCVHCVWCGLHADGIAPRYEALPDGPMVCPSCVAQDKADMRRLDDEYFATYHDDLLGGD